MATPTADIVVTLPAERYTTEVPPTKWPQSPRLTPNTGQNLALGVGMNTVASQAAYLTQFPRAAATDTATVGGTPTNANVNSITVTSALIPGGSATASYTTQTSDTNPEVASGLASAINANVNLQALGIYATVSDLVITVNHPGPAGNLTVLSKTVTGSQTITLAASGVMSGGSGPVIPYEGFTASFGNMNFHFNAGEPRELSPVFVAALVNSGAPIV